MAANPKVIFKFGTKAEYLALATKLSNALYFLTDTGELYRGELPIGQAHVITGTRQAEETNNAIITRLTQGLALANNDLMVITNEDSSKDIFIYTGSAWIQLNSNNAITARVAELEGAVADLETLLGTPPTTHTVHNDETGEDETVTDPPTGLFDDLQNHPADVIPLFNGITAGLVPVAVGELTNVEKSKLFMNALGNWVNIPAGEGGGQSTYTDPQGNVYNTVEEYVTYMISTVQYEWEPIQGE